MKPLKVLVVDDHAVLATALSTRLQVERDLEVLPPATNAKDAVDVVAKRQPDVVVMDVDLGTDDGIELVPSLREVHPPVAVVVLAGTTDVETVVAAMRSGALALVTKGDSVEVLLEAVRGAALGESRFPPRLLTMAIATLVEDRAEHVARSSLLDTLTAQERRILELMVHGLDQRTIAQQLFLSPNTIRTYTRKIYAKLRVHSNLEAVHVALRAGMRP
ncbi:MAG TPA: response regulator transcription factor [Acidimicrobiales bacterium]